MGRGCSSECQRPAENWVNRPQQKSIVSLDGREWLAAACFVLPKPEFLPSTIFLVILLFGHWKMEVSVQRGNDETAESHLKLEVKDCCH